MRSFVPRCVDPADKALALGVTGFVLNIFGEFSHVHLVRTLASGVPGVSFRERRYSQVASELQIRVPTNPS